MMYPLAGDGIPVTVTCRVLKLARQPYYRWLAAPVTARDLDEAYLANVLFDAHHDDPEFGHRLLADGAGLRACDRRPPLLHGVGRRLRRMRRRFRGHPHGPVGLHP